MGVEIDISARVNEKTIEYGIGKLNDVSSTKIQEQLVLIEKCLQEFRGEQNRLFEQIKEHSKLSILSVSKETDIKRSQIYKNPKTLKLYVENRISEIKKEDILKVNKLEQLRNDKRELSDHLDRLRQQVVDNFELKQLAEVLEAQNKRLNEQIERRQKDIYKLQKENDSLQKKLNKLNSKNVIPLR
ncbi:hypothetical protein ACFSCZ_12430 [Siminovitchia sediminis]|uniref:Uncharacterized protein n=1 Tax=Siminovitchia sediminis TaxID=1274353 RepID=A0ABW4KMS4_9BACI|nr:Uncharacterised protein [Bacillus freudenreichii]